MRLKFEYQKNKGSTEVMSEIEGNMQEVLAAIGRLIQTVYNQTPKILRPLLREAVKHLASDDSPVWKEFGDGTTVIDMSRLMKRKE